MLRKEAWFGTLLGTHLRIQNHKKFKFSGRDILPLTVKGLILTQKIYSILYSVPRVTITYTKNLNISTKKIYSILYSVPRVTITYLWLEWHFMIHVFFISIPFISIYRWIWCLFIIHTIVVLRFWNVNVCLFILGAYRLRDHPINKPWLQ